MKDWLVYLLRCADNSLYCGVTKDIEQRLAQHNLGTASKYTRSRLPVECVGTRGHLDKQTAFRLEYRIKKLPAKKKLAFLETGVLEK